MPILVDLSALDFRDIVRPGTLVCCGQAVGEPTALTARLMAQRHEIGPFSVFLGIGLSDSHDPAHADIVSFQSFCGTGANRRLAAAGVLDVLPMHYSRLPDVLSQRVDVLLLQLAQHPLDGRLSLSASCDYVSELSKRARVVVGEVNAQAPFTDAIIAQEDVDFLIYTDRPLSELRKARQTDTDRKIAVNVAELIEDGATLQFGIGSIPDGVASQLSGHRDLGIHTGLLTDGAMRLIQAGAVTNKYKGIDAGLTVTGGLLGSRELAAFADHNSTISFRPVSYTHSIGVMSLINRLVSVNSAIEVDLTGQVNTEIANGRYVGAVAGAVDFARGAFASPGGIPIVALPSTAAAEGLIRSRIVASLSGPATIARSDAGIVVTEHGRADLRHASLAERKERLIAIADPAFRDDLARDMDRITTL